jgi:hypothetical protein
MGRFFIGISAAAMALALEAPAQSWMAGKCELIPVSPLKFRYLACEDTTDYKSLNRALALKVDANPQFPRYRSYRGWENGVQVAVIGGAVLFAADMLATNSVRLMCSPSFNPSCEDIGWTTLSPWYYLGFFSVTIPLNVFISHKRIGFMEVLIGEYNRNP